MYSFNMQARRRNYRLKIVIVCRTEMEKSIVGGYVEGTGKARETEGG